MRTTIRLFIALACIVLASPVAAQDPLTDAKGLYEAASFREALTALDHAAPTSDVTEVDKYRALCLLALDLPRDAEQSLEHLAMNRPLFSLEGTDTSPRLVALFSAVRKRTLPDVAKQVYGRGRASFDAGDMADATTQFKAVIELADTAPPEHAALMSDLKVLAGGFLRLSEASGVKPKAEPQAPPSELASARPQSLPVSADRVYDSTSSVAQPPIAIAREVPSFVRPATMRGFTYQGLIQVQIDEQGNVTSAAIKKSVNASYDANLLRAARKWRFQPATVDGHPVKYVATYAITVEP